MSSQTHCRKCGNQLDRQGYLCSKCVVRPNRLKGIRVSEVISKRPPLKRVEKKDPHDFYFPYIKGQFICRRCGGSREKGMKYCDPCREERKIITTQNHFKRTKKLLKTDPTFRKEYIKRKHEDIFITDLVVGTTQFTRRCKDCGKKRKPKNVYCEDCKKIRKIEQRRRSYQKKHTPYCKVEGCNNRKPHRSQFYCSSCKKKKEISDLKHKKYLRTLCNVCGKVKDRKGQKCSKCLVKSTPKKYIKISKPCIRCKGKVDRQGLYCKKCFEIQRIETSRRYVRKTDPNLCRKCNKKLDRQGYICISCLSDKSYSNSTKYIPKKVYGVCEVCDKKIVGKNSHRRYKCDEHKVRPLTDRTKCNKCNKPNDRLPNGFVCSECLVNKPIERDKTKCRKCNKKLDRKGHLCSNCISTPSYQKITTCKDCGKSLDRKGHFCIKCSDDRKRERHRKNYIKQKRQRSIKS